jgi:hypothetical protein
MRPLEYVEHAREVEEAAIGRDVRHVGDPELIRRRGDEPAMHQIRGRWTLGSQPRGARRPLHRADTNALRLPHLARDALLTVALAALPEIMQQARCAIRLLRARVKGPQLRQEHRAARAPTARSDGARRRRAATARGDGARRRSAATARGDGARRRHA